MVRPTMCRITGTPSIVGEIHAPTADVHQVKEALARDRLVGRVEHLPLHRLERVGPTRGAHGPGDESAVVARQQRVELGAGVGREHLVVVADQGQHLLVVQAALADRDRRGEADLARGRW